MSQHESDTLSQDTAYDLLSNARRRLVISHLRDAEEPVTVTSLSERIAAWENDVPADELTDQQVKRVYVSLYQIHIPKLDEFGLLDYDKESGEVELTPAVSELDTYLPKRSSGSGDGESRRRWPLVYVGIAGLALLVYAGVLAFPSQFGWIPLTMLNVTVFVTFVVVSVGHYVLERWS